MDNERDRTCEHVCEHDCEHDCELDCRRDCGKISIFDVIGFVGLIMFAIATIISLILFGVFTVYLIFYMSLCQTDPDYLGTKHTISYQVIGDTEDAKMVYKTSNDETSGDNHVKSGYSRDLKRKLDEFNTELEVKVTNGPGQKGKVGCRILYDGHVIKENIGTGGGTTVTCLATKGDYDKYFRSANPQYCEHGWLAKPPTFF